VLGSTIVPDSTCAARNAGLRECGWLSTSANRPRQWRPASSVRTQAHRDVAATAGGEASTNPSSAHEALIGFELIVVFEVVTLEPVLAVDALLGADEAEPEIAKRCAVVACQPRSIARDTSPGMPQIAVPMIATLLLRSRNYSLRVR
jgi:hypothetical protein